MKILLLYGTNSGETLSACDIASGVFREAKHSVTLQSAETADPDTLSQFDLVVLASCTWEQFTQEGKRLDGQLQEHMQEFADKIKRRKLPNTRFAILALGDPSYTHFCGAADHLEQLVKDIKGHRVGKTLRIGGYSFALKENEQIVRNWAVQLLKDAT